MAGQSQTESYQRIFCNMVHDSHEQLGDITVRFSETQVRISRADSSNVVKNIVWSNTNLKEILPDISTPATWSTISHALDYAFQRLFRDFGYHWPASEAAVTNIWGRGYMNLSRFSDATWQLFGIPSDLIIEALGGAHPELLSIGGKPSLLLRLKHMINLLQLGAKCIYVVSHANMLFKENTKFCEDIRARLSNQIDCCELVGIVKKLQQTSDFFMCHYLLFVFGAIGSFILLKQITRSWGNLSMSSPGHLLIGLGNMPSVQMTREVMFIAQAVLEDADTYIWFLQRDWSDWRDTLVNKQVRESIENYLSNYGHRTVNVSELEMAHPRWYEDPQSLFEVIINYCVNGGGSGIFSLEVQRERRTQAEVEFIKSLPLYLRLPALAALIQVQRYTRLREIAKNHLIHRVAVGREVLLIAGKLLAEKNVILCKEDVFYLTVQDITDGLLGMKFHLAEKVLKAKMFIARFDKIAPPDVFINFDPYYPDLDKNSQIDLIGVAASPGTVTAKARKLRDPSEASRLLPGEILVCPSIDSSWIPLFFLASGIITEIGGVLSHGAIIARELGIPAVVNVSGAISAITDGQEVTVDGNCGKVFLFD